MSDIERYREGRVSEGVGETEREEGEERERREEGGKETERKRDRERVLTAMQDRAPWNGYNINKYLGTYLGHHR